MLSQRENKKFSYIALSFTFSSKKPTIFFAFCINFSFCTIGVTTSDSYPRTHATSILDEDTKNLSSSPNTKVHWKLGLTYVYYWYPRLYASISKIAEIGFPLDLISFQKIYITLHLYNFSSLFQITDDVALSRKYESARVINTAQIDDCCSRYSQKSVHF